MSDKEWIMHLIKKALEEQGVCIPYVGYEDGEDPAVLSRVYFNLPGKEITIRLEEKLK